MGAMMHRHGLNFPPKLFVFLSTASWLVAIGLFFASYWAAGSICTLVALVFALMFFTNA